MELFSARFDPSRADADAAAMLVARIEEEIDAVESLDQDRILRNFLGVIQAMLRTSYFQLSHDGRPQPYLSFKLDPSRLPWLPLPRPQFEIFVYSPRTEGVHLRGGKVARGGIRWSERREDFRTEVLGLMKAQMVKNAVIVPVGAKGGFIVKRPPSPDDGREALMDEVERCYRTFIRGLLDLTDNIVDGDIVPPPDVVRYDGDDPYLVVAADKGTAALSDVANGIALEQKFWLGDAFASGGRTGYDHKKMGITARGAWESVKRHFRESGHDVQSEDFTVVGIGDMSGDVFGNGMLLSRHIRLVGAFNHQHVFIDPTPDPESSWEERRRLFELPRSTWADYDTDLLSPGGGVFPRTAKSIRLSPEAREAIGVEDESLPPNELIRALLRAPVDLLWNGGIGTYVKAASETHAGAGDKASDAVRVNATELRCRVIGEGGNLGLTQRARIEYARGGGGVNTDAIDNSGGVDCSDREVNIKVLLDAVVAAGDLTDKQRNELLLEMTDAVAAQVLEDNYEQAETLSMAEEHAASMVDVHARFMRALEHSHKLARDLEALPSEEEIAERAGDHRGLTRPELATLLAVSKIDLHARLLDSDVPEDPYLSAELEAYFPAQLRDRFTGAMQDHRLRREITTTRVVNNMLHGAGTTFMFRLHEETGAVASDIARAYTVAREVFQMRQHWSETHALDNRVHAETQIGMLLEGRRLVERGSRWLLRNRRRPLPISDTVEHFAPGAQVLFESISRLLAPTDAEPLARRADELREAGVPDGLAARVASFGTMFAALDIVEVAHETGLGLESVAAIHFALGVRLELHWLRDRVEALSRDDRWAARARAALRDDLYTLHRTITAEVLRSGAPDAEPDERVQAWIDANPGSERYLATLADVRGGRVYDLTTLPVVLREVRNLVQAPGAA
jgi:glutamate dehydrogenase